MNLPIFEYGNQQNQDYYNQIPMNKSLALLLLAFLFSLASYAQSYVGVFTGLNHAKLAGDAPPDAKYKSLLGMNIGAHFDLKLSKSTALSIQPSFSQEGAKLSYSLANKSDTEDSLSLQLNYFSLPLLFKINTNNKRFYAIGGIETAYLLSKELKSQEAKEDLKSTISDINVALHFGAGMHIPIGYPRLFVELRYSQGLLNLTDDPLGNDIIPRVKTNGLKVLFGIEIPIRKSKN